MTRRRKTRGASPRIRIYSHNFGDAADERLDGLARTACRNLLIGTRLRQLGPKAFPAMIEIPVLRKLAGLRDHAEDDRHFKHDLDKVHRRKLQRYIKSCGGLLEPMPPPPEPLRANLELFAQRFNLDAISCEILSLVVVGNASCDLREFSALLGELSMPDCARVVATALAQPLDQVAQRIKRGSLLCRQGLLELDVDFASELFTRVSLRGSLGDALLDPSLDSRGLLESFVAEAPQPTLVLEDFAHMKEECCLARSLLRATLANKTRGVNVLLYGPTGTGKSELSRLLAKELEVPLFAVGLRDENNQSPSYYERLSSLQWECPKFCVNADRTSDLVVHRLTRPSNRMLNC